MNFEVNGISYFLTFDSGQSQWLLLTPCGSGVEAMTVHGDGTPMAGPGPLVPHTDGVQCTN